MNIVYLSYFLNAVFIFHLVVRYYQVRDLGDYVKFMEERIYRLQKMIVAPTKYSITGNGVVSVKSSDLLKTKEAQTAIRRSSEITLNNSFRH